MRDVGVQSLDAEHQIIGVKHVIGIELIRCDHVHTGQVARAECTNLVAAADDQEHLGSFSGVTVGQQRAQERLGTLGRRRLSGDQFGHRVDPLVAGPIAQSAAQCCGDHLLRGPLAVVARLGAVHDTATLELRCAGRALTCAAGALLAIRLLAAAGDLTTTLGRMGALPCRRQLRGHHLVHECDVRFGVEQFSR